MAEKNGLLPKEGKFAFQNVQTGRTEDSLLHHGLGFNTGTPYDDPRSVNSRNDDWIGPDYLIIADDPFGNLIALCIRGPHYRKVLFLDHEVVHEMPPTGQPLPAGVGIIADDFADFLKTVGA